MSEKKLSLRQRGYNLRRRLFGKYEFRDPRPIAAEAPYTFWLPPKNRIDLIRAGDIVKVMIASIPHGLEYDLERMWCIVERIEGEDVYGELNNIPFDIPQLECGTKLEFKTWHIIDYKYREGDEDDAERDTHLPEMESKQFWDRCLVDRCVLDDGVLVEYIYREEPDLAGEDDKYPDSGWRIRGDARGVSDDTMDEREVAYIAIGKVLNEDDSWLSLIDSPIGSQFIRNFETGAYEACE